jgi:hypothetical protein
VFLSNGNVYVPGEGLTRAQALRLGNLEPTILDRYIVEARESVARYGRVPGATMDLFVADLIDRGIIWYREVALALLNKEVTR